jgi:hypothetical protein
MGGGVPQGERLDVRALRCVLPRKRRDGRARRRCTSLRLRVVCDFDHAAARACIAAVRAAIRRSSFRAGTPMRPAAALTRAGTARTATRRSSSTARATSSSDGGSMTANAVAASAWTAPAADSGDRFQLRQLTPLLSAVPRRCNEHAALPCEPRQLRAVRAPPHHVAPPAAPAARAVPRARPSAQAPARSAQESMRGRPLVHAILRLLERAPRPSPQKCVGRNTTPAPQSEPVPQTPRLVAHDALSVAIGPGLSIPAAGPAH